MHRSLYRSLGCLVCFTCVVVGSSIFGAIFGMDQVLVPKIDGDFWQIAGDPDLASRRRQTSSPLILEFGRQPMAHGNSGPASVPLGGPARLGFSIVGNQTG